MKILKTLTTLLVLGFSIGAQAWDTDQESVIFKKGDASLYCQLECSDNDGWSGTTGYYKKSHGDYVHFSGSWIKYGG